MKKAGWLFVLFCVSAIAGRAQAYDRRGVLGLNYTVGPSFVVGSGDARDAGTVEPGVGAGISLGVLRNLDVRMDYDYLDADLRTQALTFGGEWRFSPDAAYSPFVGAGLGFGKPYSTVAWGRFSLKLSGGIERQLTSNVSLAGVLTYQYVQGPDPIGSVHVIEPGVRLSYHFGNVSGIRG